MSELTIYTSKQYTGKLNALAKNQKEAEELIHELACNAIFHSIFNGQITPANQLIAKMGNTSRKNDLISWMVKHGNFKYNAQEKVIEHRKQFAHDETAAHVQAEACFASPFWTEVAERKVLQEIDPLALLKGAYNKVKNEMKKAAEENRVLKVDHQEALNDMSTILSKYGIAV